MKRLFTIVLCTLMVLVAGMAWSAQQTAQMQITAQVPQAVTVSVTNLDFGNLSFSSNTPAQSTITVTASNGVNYSIGIDGGQHVGGGRHLQDSGTNQVLYELFMDSSYANTWGDDCAGGTYTMGGLATCMTGLTGTGSAQSHTVYGLITTLAPTQPAGSYTDTVTVTVVY